MRNLKIILLFALLAFSACKTQYDRPIATIEPKVAQRHIADAIPQGIQYPSEQINKTFAKTLSAEQGKIIQHGFDGVKLKTKQKVELAIAKHIIRAKIKNLRSKSQKDLQSLEDKSVYQDRYSSFPGGVEWLLTLLLIVFLLILLIWLIAALLGAIFGILVILLVLYLLWKLGKILHWF